MPALEWVGAGLAQDVRYIFLTFFVLLIVVSTLKYSSNAFENFISALIFHCNYSEAFKFQFS
jgi:hypothetical protein